MLRVRFPPTRRRFLLPFSNHSTSSSPPPEATLAPPRHHSPPPSTLPTTSLSPLSSSSYPFLTRLSLLALSASFLAFIFSSTNNSNSNTSNSNPIYSAIEKSNESLHRIYGYVIQTSAAASVLLESLASVLSSADHEVRAGFDLRVASFLADIAAANSRRRAAIVGAGDGRVVNWLLDTVAADGSARGDGGAQAEAARAVAYLLADEKVCEEVLGKPGAVGKLLRFIFSCQPQRSKKVIF